MLKVLIATLFRSTHRRQLLIFENVMSWKRTLLSAARLCLGSTILLCPYVLRAQHHGGHGIGGGVPGGNNRPTGVDETDPLKDFHRALAVQATSQQAAEFQALVKESESAKGSLQKLVPPQDHDSAAPEPTVNIADIDKLLQALRTDSRKFVDGFSAAQKSGLKDNLKRLEKADSDLEAEEKRLDESQQGGSRAVAELESRGESLTKSLTNFSNQELALGREMGVVLAQGSDLTFKLIEVKSSLNMAKQAIAVTASGDLSQVASQGDKRTFRLQMIVDLSDVRQNLTELLRAQFDAPGSCGERLAIRNATIVSSPPASILGLQVHYERWSCLQFAGQAGRQELAEEDGSVEVKLTPVVEKANSLKLVSELSKINAGGMMGESLRSGDLGEELRDKVRQPIFAALRAGVNLQKCLPAAAREFAVIQNAKFQDAGPGRLGVIVEGELALSDEQVNLMASQLNEATFAQGTASQPGPQVSNSTPNR